MPSCSASVPAICRWVRQRPSSCSRFWRLLLSSSCAACASAEGKSDEFHNDGGPGRRRSPAQVKPEEQPPLGPYHVVCFPRDVRDLLPDTALLHGGYRAQERRRSRAHGDQSLDH